LCPPGSGSGIPNTNPEPADQNQSGSTTLVIMSSCFFLIWQTLAQKIFFILSSFIINGGFSFNIFGEFERPHIYERAICVLYFLKQLNGPR
jgi:hypothetical protein